MVVSRSVPAKTVPEFIDYAKANPGKVNMPSPGTGSAGHVFGELFKIMTGVHIVHVPYGASFVPDLLSGQVQVGFPTIGAGDRAHPNWQATRACGHRGDARGPIARCPRLWANLVSGYEASGWTGIGAPRSYPPEFAAQVDGSRNKK
jgi:tripartite-type tricarboxylate transporter receptor subunit TctC